MFYLQHEIVRHNFEFPFETAHGLKTFQDALLIKLTFGQWTGYGECTSIPYYNVAVQQLQELLKEYHKAIEQYAFNGPERFWHFLHHLFPEHNFLIAALDIASWDVFAKMKNTALHHVIGLQWKNLKPTCYTIGIQDIAMLEQIVSQKPSPIYKLKVNGIDDITHVATLRTLKPTSTIWIDANGAWQEEDAQYILKELVKLGVTVIEQPFAVGDDEGVLRCREWAPSIDFIADESCKDLKDLLRICSYYNGVNIKLVKCGGLTPALQMMQFLKKEKKKIMIGNMCESQGGANVLAHLIPIVDYVDIDGPLLLQTNASLVYHNGLIDIPNKLGSGYVI
jgi:L-alanine-DL-glutamate epimerase-like enolase superfamily enzyme